MLEIDRAVIRIARDFDRFTYPSRCLPDPAIRLGDARLSLVHDSAASLDLFALDASSSHAMPMHLMSREAFGPRGLLLVRISGRFLDLDPWLPRSPPKTAGLRRRSIIVRHRSRSASIRQASGSPCRAIRWHRPA